MYKLSMDFNCGAGSFTNIEQLFNSYGVPNTYIEIGVYEGSTVFWLSDNYTKYNKNLQIYAIDPHNVSTDLTTDFVTIKENFLYNLNLNVHKNIHYINKQSKNGLIDLINQNVKAELIYIDGDHKASEVLTDLVLSWQLLNIGGVILCDDTTTWRYIDENKTESAQMSVRMAVEMFMACNWHKIKPLSLPNTGQTAFIKTC